MLRLKLCYADICFWTTEDDAEDRTDSMTLI